jgi:hypothetical protein
MRAAPSGTRNASMPALTKTRQKKEATVTV